MTDSFGRLDGKRILVTGASSGIGRAIAEELAAAGGRILMHASQTRPEFEALIAQLKRAGRQVEGLCCNFEDETGTVEFAEVAWQQLGAVDVLVNNAGVDLLTGVGRDWKFGGKLQKLLEVDVRGTILIARSIGRRMVASGGGSMINIGWDQADRGMEGDSGELFATAKNAIMGFTRSLAMSLAPRVRVNCIAPGWIRTAWGHEAGEQWQQRVLDETPLRRWGEPGDVAAMARFLASDSAAYITGQVFNVNGGAIR